ncbi:hypothetical protein B0H66DRAFT_596519 [Apodospora peruviana]|uniref:Uncharacterized protein n=1 Tax=Apodospora peruviana TaxID=516989 RepID=A0AAE0MFA2_9PEZI|nr:hypothetical protein B0H66DRAFT_596519 [Apodospora peruviana]
MCLIFTCGEHTFRKEVEGYEGVICQCYNCGNYRGHVVKSHPWFTFCFIPVIPLSFKGYEDISCPICNFQQPVSHRPDVQQRRYGGAGGPGPGGPGHGMPLQQQGHGAPPIPPHPSHSPGPNNNAPMRYG